MRKSELRQIIREELNKFYQGEYPEFKNAKPTSDYFSRETKKLIDFVSIFINKSPNYEEDMNKFIELLDDAIYTETENQI